MEIYKIEKQDTLTFDDVLLLPNFTGVKRDEVDISSFITSDIKLSVPILSAPMDTVTTSDVAITLGKLGGLGVIHRNMTIKDQVEEVKKVGKVVERVAAAVGIGKDLEERVEALVKSGTNIIVIDSSHGYSKWVVEATVFIAQKYKKVALISGSVATAAGAKVLIDAGADALRVGMGPGSICTTRIVAGIGVPQITAIMETVSIAKKYGIPVIADGGLRFSGDIVKAIAAGAGAVMSGSLFAGTLEAPGKVITVKGKKYKSYRGMGSVSAMRQGSAARYGQEYRKGQEKKLLAEGIEGLVPYKGTVEDIITELSAGLRAGMYYTGCQTIQELQENTRFIRVTPASLTESHPHDIVFK